MLLKKENPQSEVPFLYPHKSLLCHNNPVIKKFVHYPLLARPFVMIAIFSRALLATINKASVPGDSGPILQRDLMVTTTLASDWSAEVT